MSQVQGGSEHFIGCFSKSCDAAQSNNPSFEGELLAVILGFCKFEHILHMKRYLIRTDSSAITFLTSIKESRGMFARWAVYLSSFDFEIKHIAGKSNTAADSLSRMLFPTQPGDPDEPDSVVN